MRFVALALAGALGAFSRYGLSLLVQRWAGTGFPYATTAVNILGCLLFGLLWGLLCERHGVAAAVKLTVFTGFLGAFTTFSTYAYETVALLEEGRPGAACWNAGLQNGLGFLMLWLGLRLARL